MSRTLFLKLNSFFPTDESVNDAISYLQTKTLPSDLDTNKKRNTFIKRLNQFEFKDNKLMYKPLSLEVIRKSEIESLLTDLYANPEIGLGKSMMYFYKYLQMHYINIPRTVASEFIRQQSNYQLTQPRKNRVNKPIISFSANELWAIDLIDLNPYIGNNKWKYRYILNCVDVFSRKVWLERLKYKEAKEILGCMQKIFTRAKITPNRIMLDNGTEFKGEFEEYCNEHDITLSNTRTYSPQANGIVERSNREVRKKLKSLFVENEHLDWTGSLPTIENNINNSYHSVIKCAPNDVWTSDHVKPATVRILPFTANNKRVNAISEIAKTTKQKIAAFKATEFAVGDKVRASMSSLFSDIRRIIKQGNTKTIVIEYAPDVFTIKRIIHPRNKGMERLQYTLTDDDGHDLFVGKARTNASRFYGSELIFADGDIQMSTEKALKLNGARRIPDNDVYIVGGKMYFDDIPNVTL